MSEEDGFVEIMLFGVPVKVDPMRKTVSMSNLMEYEPGSIPKPAAEDSSGYASVDDALPLPCAVSRSRKRGTPWTEEEHRLFLVGLEKVGKGDWRGISRNYVKTRTPTQVASHAQKYFLRRTNGSRRPRRRRSSLFDISTETAASAASSSPALGLSLSLSSAHHTQMANSFKSRDSNGSSMIRVT